jgi:hypothetical protein
VSTPDPLVLMEVAVNRVSEEHRGQRPPFLPGERIALGDLVDRGAGEIGEARVVATFIDGAVVHERPELDG